MRMNEIKIVSQFVPRLDRGLGYAEACFETFCVYKGNVFQAHAHQLRLQEAMAAYGWDIALNMLSDWFEESIEYAGKLGENVLVRLTVSGGDAAWGMLPSKPQPPSFYVQAMVVQSRAPAVLKSVLWPFALREKTAKFTSDYAEGLRAMQLWKASLKAKEQALVCSEAGMLLSTLTSNIALYREGQWYTPSGLGVLQGIVRQYLLDKDILIEASCPIAWLDDCEAMVCLNSGVFVQPVSHINGRALVLEHAAQRVLMDAFAGEAGVYIDKI